MKKSKHSVSANNRYYLMRHGESLANRRGLIVSHPENAIENYGLTTKGAEQVMDAALKTRLSSDTVIISSDFKRAKETADIVSSVISSNDAVTLEPKLRERNFGDWELADHANYETVWQHDINNPSQSQQNVESVDQVLDRGLSVLTVLDKKYTNKNILLVGHGDVLQILLAHHHNINPRFHRSLSSIGNADIRSLAKLELAARSPAA